MIAGSPALSAQSGARQRQRSGLAAFLGLVALLLPLGVASLVVPLPFLVLLAAGGALVVPWLWRRPVRSVYVLFAGAVLIEELPMGFPDSLTDKIPLFTNLNSSAGFALPIAPVEVLMLVAVLVWLAKGVATRSLDLPSRRLGPAYALFLVIVLAAEAHGLLTGGDFKLSLWELRPQVYGFIMFFLAACLVRERRDIARLTVLFLAAVAVKAAMGVFRYFITLHGSLSGQATVLAHEESYFLGLFLVALVVALIWYRRRRAVLLLVLLAPLIGLADLANRRRVAILALQLGVVIVVMLAIRFEPALRKRLVVLSSVTLAATAAFMVAFWDAQYGLPGQLVRPIKSVLFGGDERDILSNLYRVAENANLLAAFKSSPLFGLGFGKPFPIVFPMADISYIYPLWNVIPHNTLLWLGIRTGALGVMAFWGLVGLAIAHATHQLNFHRDGLIKAFAAFAVAAIAAELVVAWGDLQLENARNMMFFGVLLGLIDSLPRMRDASAA